MRYFTAVLMLSWLAAFASANAESGAIQDISERDTNPLEDRATALVKCPDRNGCKCRKKTKQGQYCGGCRAVTDAGKGGTFFDIFECNPNGGCCNYGPAKKCEGSQIQKNCPA